MNIRDLRIGDYVIYEGEFHKAECLFGKCEGVLLYGVEEIINACNTKPIPLTEELLKKIGIKFLIGNNTSRTYSIGYCSLEKIVNTDYYTFTAEAGKLNIRTKKHIKFLHELQHELYDAGVEFKIEL